jgi:hypothetical protein
MSNASLRGTDARGSRAPLFEYERWRQRLDSSQYAQRTPFPYAVFDDFLEVETAKALVREFPPLDEKWAGYTHVNERKFGRTKRSTFPPALGAIVDEFNGPRFISFLEDLTGIRGLLPDESLEGGGLHQSKRGGFLNIHADFTGHPHKKRWQRRVNLLLYLNEDWRDEYGGKLELWDRGMQRCEQRIAPLFNRAVIFNTDPDSFHGHPLPMTCPEGVTRKSIALYYFTEEAQPFMVRSTEYRARPDDGLRRLAIYADKMALRGYDFAKRRLGLSDRFAQELLRIAFRRRKG